MVLHGKDCQRYGREPDRENTVKVWEDHAIEGAIVVIVKAVKAIKLETINSCWRKLCPDVVHDFIGVMTEPIKDIMKEIVDMAHTHTHKSETGWEWGLGGWRVSR